MKPNWYSIITDAIERGLKEGLNRSRKHTDDPEDDEIIEAQYAAITLNLTEVITFDDIVDDFNGL